ncbi:ParA family protein [Shewanella sp. Isolate13]|uniref:ParA family protein n=1 Tax=Shewanella sp. Isolate13 TaxID=2908531 RepID=UPI001EFCD41E|nr:ParA family protein [Shewanella sp. Isolate13]MCG9731142.1 ParA family protein [Shewanella sp. Isolate13]
MSKRIVVFNHKGGVSKTTSVYNLGWMLAKKKRVLVVDADPQCNLSNLILGDDFESYYTNGSTKNQNIKDGVSAAFDAKPSPIVPIDCYSPERAGNLYLLAGHANLSEYDAALTFAQTSNNALSTLQNLPGAFSELLKLTEEKYDIDVTIIDLNPSLSSINQNLFLSSHGFILPTNPDPFSIMALDTLTNVLPRWMAWKNTSSPLFEDSAYPMLEGTPKFLGCLIQRFNIRKGKAAAPFRDNITEIKETISDKLFCKIQKSGMTLTSDQYGADFVESHYCLGEIPDFQGLLPKSYAAGVPVFELENSEIKEVGTVLEQLTTKRDRFNAQFEDISEKVDELINYA